MSFLTLDAVTKRFDDIVAVDSVSCRIDRGQVVGFLGPNGAGKSTTMRLITQYYEPDAGSISRDGVPLGDAGRDAKRRIGYLAENNPLYADMLPPYPGQEAGAGIGRGRRTTRPSALRAPGTTRQIVRRPVHQSGRLDPTGLRRYRARVARLVLTRSPQPRRSASSAFSIGAEARWRWRAADAGGESATGGLEPVPKAIRGQHSRGHGVRPDGQ